MHAPLPPPVRSPQAKPRLAPRSDRSKQQRSQQEIAIEVGAKLAVNSLLAIVAGLALVKLLSYNLSQETKLAQLQTEVASVEDRVEHLRANFDLQFDAQQTQQLMHQQKHRVNPNQVQIVWLEPVQSEAISSAQP